MKRVNNLLRISLRAKNRKYSSSWIPISLHANGGVPLTILAVVITLSLLIAASSHGEQDTIAQAPEEEHARSGTVSLEARFPVYSEEIAGIFKRSLPDSGVVPVMVTVTNETDHPVVIQNSSGLELGGNFDGFSLVTGRNTYHPIHPMESLMRALAVEKGIKYRTPGFWGLTLGIIVVPGLGLYYIYKEIVSGRFYRPIFKNSLYPAQPNWSMRPVVIEPGGEVEGFLYFFLPPGENPYPVVDSGVADSSVVDSVAVDLALRNPDLMESPRKDLTHELRLRACVLQVRGDSIPMDELLLVRDDGASRGRSSAGTDERGGDGGLFFALRRTDKSGKKRELVFGRVNDLEREPHDAFEEVATVSGKSATIPDASVAGSRAVCAINFKSKSKVYAVDAGNEKTSVRSEQFQRKIRRVFVIDDGYLVLTENEFCYYLTEKRLKTKRRVNFTHGVEDAMIFKDRLLVMHKSGTIKAFGTTGDKLLKELDRYSLPKAKGKIVGPCSGELVLLREGSRIAGDTLLVLGAGNMKTAGLLMLPGRVEYAACRESKIILQLENGTVLFLELDDERTFSIYRALFVPFGVSMIYTDGDGIAAIGADGSLMRGSANDFYPGASGVHEVTVPVEPPLIQ